MTTLVHAASTMRKSARLAYGYVTAACIALLVLFGVCSRELRLGWEHMLLTAAFVGVVALRVVGRVREVRARSGSGEALLDFELGCLLFAAGHALVQRLGGLLSPFYPVLYVLAAFTSAFAARAQGRLILLCAIALEAPVYFFTEGHLDPKPYALHALFLLLFGLLNATFTQAELTRVRLRPGFVRRRARFPDRLR